MERHLGRSQPCWVPAPGYLLRWHAQLGSFQSTVRQRTAIVPTKRLQRQFLMLHEFLPSTVGTSSRATGEAKGAAFDWLNAAMQAQEACHVFAESPTICRYMNENRQDHLISYLRRFGSGDLAASLDELERVEMTQVAVIRFLMRSVGRSCRCLDFGSGGGNNETLPFRNCVTNLERGTTIGAVWVGRHALNTETRASKGQLKWVRNPLLSIRAKAGLTRLRTIINRDTKVGSSEPPSPH
jgi:hypothetical protein